MVEAVKHAEMGISVVIPVYGSEGVLRRLLERLGAALVECANQFEVILVNDGSADRSWNVIQDLTSRFPWVRGICLMRNYGQHNAVLAGIRAARFETIVTMDDDLQHPPEELHKLLQKLNDGYDVVYGTPEQEQHGWARDFASVVTKTALKSAMGAETARMVTAWRVFRTRLRDAFADYQSPLVSIDVLLTWGTTKFSFVRVRHEPRAVGHSNYTFAKLLRHALNMMTGFSVLPLQLASVIGFAFTLFGLCVLIYVVGRYLAQGTTVAGFPFLASIIAIFSGAQLFSLGIIGEYLARIHLRSLGKPTYVVNEDTCGTGSTQGE